MSRATSPSSQELTGGTCRRARAHRRRGEGPPVAADRRRRPGRAGPRARGQGVDGARRGHLRRHRRRHLRRPRRGRRASSSASSVPVEPDPMRHARYDAPLRALAASSIPGILELSEAGLLRPMWWPAGADAAEPSSKGPHTRCPRPTAPIRKQFHEDVPQRGEAVLPEGLEPRTTGACSTGWPAIFRPEEGRTVMLAIDHGYFQGPTTGLERVDLAILPLVAARRRADGHPRHTALRLCRRPCDRDRRPGQRRAEHPQGALQRGDRDRRRRRRPAMEPRRWRSRSSSVASSRPSRCTT